MSGRLAARASKNIWRIAEASSESEVIDREYGLAEANFSRALVAARRRSWMEASRFGPGGSEDGVEPGPIGGRLGGGIAPGNGMTLDGDGCGGGIMGSAIVKAMAGCYFRASTRAEMASRQPVSGSPNQGPRGRHDIHKGSR